MAALTKNQMIVRVARVIKDNADPPSNQLLKDEEIEHQIDYALERFSLDNPNEEVHEITSGNGSTYDFAVPTGWQEGFSTIRSIEFPANKRPAEYLEEEDFEIFKKLASSVETQYIRFNNHTPTSTDTARILWTRRRAIGASASDSTIPLSDEPAVIWLASSYCCDVMANKSSASSDALLSADSTDYRDMQTRYRDQAQEYWNKYCKHLGIDPKESVGPASAQMDLDITAGWPAAIGSGTGFLTHSRRKR